MIIGPSGCGKTTLGKLTAKKLGYPFFDVDDYIWRKDSPEPYTEMYSREEKISRLSEDISDCEHFVMAGSMSSFHQYFDEMFAMMVFLYADPDTRVSRLRKRSLDRFGDRVEEGGDMHRNNEIFISGNYRYESDGSPNIFSHREWMDGLPCIKLELDGKQSPERNAEKIVDRWLNDLNERTMNIRIKKMETEEEIRGKAFVHWSSWHEAYPGMVSDAYLEKLSLEVCEKIAFQWPDDILIAKSGEKVVGFIGCGLSREEENCGEVFALYLLPEYYGKGVGLQLMAAALEYLDRYPKTGLWVLKENRRAIRFYEKCGFIATGKEIYNKNVDATEIRMILNREAL